MVFTNYGFSVIRNWMVGGELTSSLGSFIVGTGSGAIAFANISLDSGLGPTLRGYSAASGIGYTAEFEGLVDSGDITTGSLCHEIGIMAVSGQNLWFRALMAETALNGSVQIIPLLTLAVK